MLAPHLMHMHRHTQQKLTPVDENHSRAQLAAKVRREIFAARSRELPWEYRVEWAHKGGQPFPSYSVGRAETEIGALLTARTLLRDATESADPRAVAAWIKGPGDEEYRRVTP
jgi:hypothetical protein